MADFPYGDIPAWIALGVSACTIIQQSNQNNKALLEKEEQKTASKNNLTNLKRQLRAEQMITDIDELLALAVDYWTQSEGNGSPSAIMIKVKSQDLSLRCNEYRSFLEFPASSDFSAIRRLITGGQFEVKSRKAIATNAPLIRDASNKVNDFRTNLRRYIDKIDNFQ
jgi:S1-C subfamily serine protease